MNESTPHFLRCSWCANYFDAGAEAAAIDNNCCAYCAAGLPSQMALSGKLPPANNDIAENIRWIRCYICRKAVQLQVLADRNNSLETHLQHTREEQKEKLRRKLEILADSQSINEVPSKMDKQIPKYFYEKFSLRTWYPDSADCNSLFWYHYVINI